MRNGTLNHRYQKRAIDIVYNLAVETAIKTNRNIITE